MDYDQYATQLLNSVFENAKQSSSNNNWHLLEQLEEQKKLILEQQNLLRSLQSNIRPVSPPIPQDIILEDTGLETVPSLPAEPLVPSPASSVPLKLEQQVPIKPKQKSFLRRSLSRRSFKNVDNNQPKQSKPEQKPKKNLKQSKKAIEKHISVPPKEALVVDQTPSFWKPRQERPKGWWKGNRGTTDESSRTRRTVQPKKVPSLQGTKAKRPMAFKTPSVKKKKQVPRKKINAEPIYEQQSAVEVQESMPMPIYVMPQQSVYYQQPMTMVAPPYMMPIANRTHPTSKPNQDSIQVPRRKTSVLNPREYSNDKCLIM
ncbi:hypothetical protein BD560DRAFT_424676 [Blakeslea trispora]|nr:hypothetical protein BD560DRAFT_424676 [Blakeslea trispora]